MTSKSICTCVSDLPMLVKPGVTVTPPSSSQPTTPHTPHTPGQLTPGKRKAQGERQQDQVNMSEPNLMQLECSNLFPYKLDLSCLDITWHVDQIEFEMTL